MHIVATAGHVDHGKSTLLRALTGMEPDRWEQERARGLTIDLGFVWTQLTTATGDETVAFVDVPGHHAFLPNMLAGAGGSPAAMLVVAADDGWSAQSQEHLEILHLLDVPVLLTVVTKVAPAGVTRAREVAVDVRRRLEELRGEAGPVVLADPLAEMGVGEVATTLADRLGHVARPAVTARGRLWIDRSFTVTGAGTVVTGTLRGAPLTVGETVTVLPAGRPARVRGLQCLGRSVDRADPESRVAVNLAGVAHEELGRGDALAVGPPPAWPTTDAFDARVRVLAGHEIGRRGAWQLHAGTAEVEARLHPVLGQPITTEGDLRIELRHPLPLRSGDRFVVREVGRRRVVGGGEVLVPWARGRLRGTSARLQRAEQLDAVASSTGTRRAAALVAAGVDRPAGEILVAVGEPTDALVPDTVRLGDHLVVTARLRDWSRVVQEHVVAAGAGGTDLAALTAPLVETGCPEHLVDGVVEHLVAGGVVARRGPVLLAPSQQEAWEQRAERRRADLLQALDAWPWSPPSLDATVDEVDATATEVQQLSERGELVVHGRFAFTRRALVAAAARLAEVERDQGPFTVAAARDALGISRRHAIPLLELLDARGFTRFDGQVRQVVDTPRP